MNESSLRNDYLFQEAQLRDVLAGNYSDTLGARMDSLLATSETWLEVTSEEEAGQVSDLRKGFQALLKAFDAAHSAEKAPWTGLAKVVDGFFFPKRDKLKAELVRINGIEIRFLELKAAAERRRREEEAERARKVAEEALKRAQEEEAARRASANPNAEPPRADDRAMEEAIAADQAAQRAQKAAAAKPADLSRTRGDLGSVSSLKRRWTGEMVDRARLDLEALRGHLSADDLNKAIRAWVKANSADNKPAPVLPGARVWQETYL